MKNRIITLISAVFILFIGSLFTSCRSTEQAPGSIPLPTEKPTAENQDEYVMYTGQYEELKDSVEKQSIVVWEKDSKFWLRYKEKDYEIQRMEQHQFLFASNRILDSNSVIFAGIQENRATVCKIGTYLFSRVFSTVDTIPILPKGAVQSAIKANRSQAVNLPSKEKTLISLLSLQPSIQHSIRLANSNNPLHEALIAFKKPYLAEEPAKALAKVEESLQQEGLSLVIYQAYLPLYVEQTYYQLVLSMNIEKAFHETYKKNLFSTGCAVDVGLFDQKAQQFIDMGSHYLDDTNESMLTYFGGTSLQRYYRQLLHALMYKNGFKPYSSYWWGYLYQTNDPMPSMQQEIAEELPSS